MGRSVLAGVAAAVAVAAIVAVVSRDGTPAGEASPAAPAPGPATAPDALRAAPATSTLEEDHATPAPAAEAARSPARSHAERARAEPATAAEPVFAAAAAVRFDIGIDVDARAPEPIVTVELARAALRSVGKDRGAEAIWKRAINDPGLPAGVRSDLIEDLNDEGYLDPDELKPEDLPLILARLRLIERQWPYAMDETNAAAFQEAYMDLLEMLIRLQSRGR
jgi:hypothetical protein